MLNSGYLSKSACRGYRPRKLSSCKGRSRPQLIARLARDRDVARFIVAPEGYGKTHLAIEYAETMFSWVHVFWLNAKSPCFIRDLDDRDIARVCFDVDAEAKLVVIAGIPPLSEQRRQLLSDEIDALIARGCEVVITCAPPSDLLGDLQRDRVRLGALDLLLDDEEADQARPEDERARTPAEELPPARRVPALAGHPSPEAVAAFVAGSLSEDVPADLLLAVCSALVLHRGRLDDLGAIGPIDLQLIEDAMADYPHLGCDVEEGRFEAPLVDVEAIAHVLRVRFDDVVERSSFDSRDDLACAWADILLRRGVAAERACDAVRTLCTADRRSRWVLEHARQLVRVGCFYPLLRLIRSMRKSQYRGRDRIRALEGLCLRVLDDMEGTLNCAKRCAFDAGVSVDAKALGLLMAARFGAGELRERASAELADWAIAISQGHAAKLAWWEVLVEAWVAGMDGAVRLALAWQSLEARGASPDELCIIASWLFSFMEASEDDRVLTAVPAFAAVERFVRARLASDEPVELDFFAASAGLAMEGAHVKGMSYADGILRANILLGLRHAEMALFAQRRQFEQDAYKERMRQVGWDLPSTVEEGRRVGLKPAEQPDIPLLRIRVFGQFDVSIGDVPIGHDQFGRRCVRVLLVMLATSIGRDLSRDAIASAIWPSSTLEVARKNFYTAWSKLRRLLTLSDNSCPYLVRHQFGCRLDSRYVQSDIARLEEICRELLFGRLDFEEWLDIYTEIDRDFADDLLPAEQANYLVEKARVDCRNRLVDALVTATQRLIDAGSPQYGIWFARTAIEHERLREDAYVALMRAQAAYNQRTAAMMTYHNCRRILADELGIDPSPEATALYERLLGDE